MNKAKLLKLAREADEKGTRLYLALKEKVESLGENAPKHLKKAHHESIAALLSLQAITKVLETK